MNEVRWEFQSLFTDSGNRKIASLTPVYSFNSLALGPLSERQL